MLSVHGTSDNDVVDKTIIISYLRFPLIFNSHYFSPAIQVQSDDSLFFLNFLPSRFHIEYRERHYSILTIGNENCITKAS